MHINLSSHCYLGVYQEQIIVLDSIKDQFHLIDDKEMFDAIYSGLILKEPLQGECRKLQDLVDLDVIFYGPKKEERDFDVKRQASGAPHLDWRMSHRIAAGDYPRSLFFSAIKTLRRVHSTLKKPNGLYTLLQEVKLPAPRHGDISCDQNTLLSIGRALTSACSFYPKKTVCLPWAIAFSILAKGKNIDVKMMIGVQCYPFASHAWVELNGKTLFDDEHYQDQLTILFRGE